ncbi:hypothetical protein DNHGIG_25430 [Collibacillus ludicampi]|uniref:Helix-turn-helix domain-containing protein n=1 Tax=Collibacillus ludicampi TaxID=2771369 RepID=A0AAV4LGR5_9BACL|nr:helix-turn-helix domain-containing protein [Collibacillus ludicampi]GIM46994.1 hypothetical protein DNHGIG_25430 [Collibacillus ludicampi]
MTDELLDFKQAAEFLRVSDKVLMKLLQEENVPARKIGNQWRFSKQALINWIAEGNSRDYTKKMRDDT